jgi:hypothetical protein
MMAIEVWCDALVAVTHHKTLSETGHQTPFASPAPTRVSP